MKKGKTSAAGKKVKKDGPSLISRLRSAFEGDTFKFVIGAVITVTALYMLIACLSFLFTGGADQSLTDATADAASDVAANSAGSFGARISQILINRWFGLPTLLLLVYVFMLGCNLMIVSHFRLGRCFISFAFLTVWLSILFSLVLNPILKDSFIVAGGNHGLNAELWLRKTIGLPGTILILLLTLVLYFVWLTRRTIEWIRGRLSFKRGDTPEQADAPETDGTDAENAAEDSLQPAVGDYSGNGTDDTEITTDDDFRTDIPSDISDEGESGDSDLEPQDDSNDDDTDDNGANDKGGTDEVQLQIVEGKKEEEFEGEIPQTYDPRLDLPHYKFPTTDLLNQFEDASPTDNRAEQEANKDRIIKVLRSFGIEITSICATQGPTVTLYEITPAEGIRISKIRNLEDDIALSLAAYGIRIIAPMPGKGTIGIEVPNNKPVMVPMLPIIRSKTFVESNMELPIALGRTITNEIFIKDLTKMPHLLVAGATGMGKSVGLNAIVTSLLYKKHPAEMKLVMVDPKMVEFSIYSSIEKHFLAKLPDTNEPIITDPTKVVHTLKSLCTEMDNRYELLKDANVRSIIEYNKMFISNKLSRLNGHRYLPYIVVVIDEFGDLIMTAGKEIETPICRIAQKARAVGMHMIIATQRPTTNIITGTIKANFPARIAFRVTSMIDSRTILDRPGANQLIGRGDMLYSQGGDPERVQCAFVDTPEVQNICTYISKQPSYLTAYELPEYVDETEGGTESSELSRGELDPIFEDAARVIVSSQQGSTSLIQRKFSIGYNRAGRIMDQLERAGIVGPQDGSKPRQVLCIDDIELQQKIDNLR